MGLYFGRNSEKEIRESEMVRREIINGIAVSYSVFKVQCHRYGGNS